MDFDDLEAQMQRLRESAEQAARDSGSPAEPLSAATQAQAFLEAVHRAKTDPTVLPLRAVYADGGVLILDFASARATFDNDVWLNLRVHSHLPCLEPLAAPRGDLADEELDRVLWMLGMAAGNLPLLDAPKGWWHAPLHPVHLQTVGRYSIRPLHLDMARALARGGVTPAQLRQQCRASELDLVAFLQACLLLCLVSWRPARLPAWAEDEDVPDAPEDAPGPDVNPPGASA